MTDKYVTKEFCDVRFTSLRSDIDHSKKEIVGDLTIQSQNQYKEYEKYVKQEIDRIIKEINERSALDKQRASLSFGAKAAIVGALITSTASVISTLILVFAK